MLENLINLDEKLFVYLNNLGSENFDAFWLLITKQIHWTPFFVLLLYIIYKKIGTKQTLVLLVTVAIMLTFTNEMTDLIKNHFERLRPCNNENIKHTIRIVKASDTFGYFSGHASNSCASMTFIFLVLRKHYKYTYLIFLFPLIFAYSRIYLGLHYPLDIISGYAFGVICGVLFYKIFTLINIKWN